MVRVSLGRCIFCLGSSGPFSSEEHVIPEGLGNKGIVLPRGLVCDPCNNGILANLDDALISLPFVRTAMLFNGVAGKKNKPPKAVRGLRGMKASRRRGRGHVVVRQDGSELQPDEDGKVEFEFEVPPIGHHRLELVYRALFKQVLGLLYLEFGEASLRLHPVRRLVLGAERVQGALALGTKIRPSRVGWVHYQFCNGHLAAPLYVHAHYMGVELAATFQAPLSAIWRPGLWPAFIRL